tara:strand:+ start:11934 stop:12230 length:297 start_codon:yes stop_codon:yes gene_type:complete
MELHSGGHVGRVGAGEKRVSTAKREVEKQAERNGIEYLIEECDSEVIGYVKKLETALNLISCQALGCEMESHQYRHADWESGYEHCVEIARTAAGEIK